MTSAYIKWLLVLSLITLSHQVGAAGKNNRWYEIEVIVFSQDKGNGEFEEYWPNNSNPPNIGAAYSLSASSTNRLPYPVLGLEQRKLQDEWNKLRWSKAHTPMAHIGWRQPALGKKDAPIVRITSKTPGPEGRHIDGTLQVAVSRYLHAYPDLVMSEQPVTHTSVIKVPSWKTNLGGLWDEQPKTTVSQKQYRMKQHRRMRSGELHYIDHPLFGILIQVRRHAAAKAKTEVIPAPAT